jgi:putative ABC transport system permease protein
MRRAVWSVVRAAVARRRLQTLVIGAVALLSTGTVVLAVGLLVLSNAPFDHAFARQAGAHAAVTFDPSLSTVDAVAATAHGSGVTAAAGPFDAVQAQVSAGDLRLGQLTLVGRAQQEGSVDRLTLDSGRWLSGPGEVVLAREGEGPPGTRVGDTLTVAGVDLRIVGTAVSVTRTADAWVWPGQSDVLHGTGVTASRQMLYRFATAGSDAQVTADVSTVTAGLPHGAVLGSASYLVAKRQTDSGTAPVVPFVVAFAVLGLVMSVLIIANVVSGAVVAGYRNIGVLKTVGFGPRQVVAAYAGQVLAPGLVGCLAGAVLGNLLAVPVLAQTGRAYNVSTSGGVAGWVDLLAVLTMPAVMALAAVVPATRAGLIAPAQAIAIGRAPRSGHGFRVRRALHATKLPLPLRFGLGTPFARPARTAVTLIAVLLGSATVVFAVGLSASLHRVAAADTRTAEVPVQVDLDNGDMSGGPAKVARPGSGNGPAGPGGPGADPVTVDPATVLAAIRAQPGTARVVGVTEASRVRLVGYTGEVAMDAYDGDPSWVGIALISGRWFHGADEVVAGSGLLRTTGHAVGDTLTITGGTGRRQVTVVGEAFELDHDNGMALLSDAGTLTGLTDGNGAQWYEVGLKPGTDVDGYVSALSNALGQGATVSARGEQNSAQTIAILLGLVATLTVLLAAVAGLGVFNTVVLNTRERVHEIGVLKTLGMTPRQVSASVVASMAGIGLVAGALAVPLGDVLQHWVVPIMADAAGTGIPASFVDVYRPLELVGLAAAGIVLAVLGALVPAGWAARARIATALRAE